MKVMMVPNALNLVSGESGIHTLVRAWAKYLPQFGVEFVDPKADSFDLLAVHAGMSREYGHNVPLVSHLHGLYWTADYDAPMWEYKANRDVIDSIRYATSVTVPSAWVAETLQRDMHINPHVVGHAIDWQEWQHDQPNDGYILGYAKNRAGTDVCNPAPMGELAMRFPKLKFLGTFAPKNPTPNIKATGLVKHAEMKRMVQRAAVMCSTVKETFGILHLEAMASGVPVLGFRQGGILETVQHGVNGYLAKPGDYDDLAKGLEYCLKHREALGANGREMAKHFTWAHVAEQLRDIYAATLAKFHQPATVSVIIPCYNYGEMLTRAVESALAQNPAEIIIVDNNSTDSTKEMASALAAQHPTVQYTNCPAQGVAHARNHGIRLATSKYIVPLDADDKIEPGFLDACVKALESDRSLGVAYTRLQWIKADKTTGISAWPAEYNYDEFLKKKNQVPTCAMFRREMWERLGGYRQRYAPDGQGAEDAEFFLRAGASGWGGKLASQEALFTYSWGTGRTNQAGYSEPPWLNDKPWVEDRQHPFASQATPANKLSHPVRQYDQPLVSVIIPVGPNHEQHLIDALDSLEAQTFRRWEAIVVFDTGKDDYAELLTSHPFVRAIYTDRRGAGAARNAGAEIARAPLLLFLDADDWLRPQAIMRMVQAWQSEQSIIYSDYAGHAHISDSNEVRKLQMQGRLESHNERTKETVALHQAFDYDCERAVQQPAPNGGQFYIWNLIASLVPRRWHEEIGGFDEKMPSWEDWDYWLRMARAGKCFVRITEPLVDYRFYTGTRRETGRQIYESLIEYLTEKYKDIKVMGCGSCGGGKKSTSVAPAAAPQMAMRGGMVTAENVVWVRLSDGNMGDHRIIGHATRTDYGYRKDGDLFKMVQADIRAQPHKYTVVPDPNVTPASIAIADQSTEAAEPAPVDVAQFVTWQQERRRKKSAA